MITSSTNCHLCSLKLCFRLLEILTKELVYFFICTLFSDWHLTRLLRLALNWKSSCDSLQSSWDDRHMPLHPTQIIYFYKELFSPNFFFTLETELIDILGFPLEQLILFYSPLNTFPYINPMDNTDGYRTMNAEGWNWL